MIPVRLQVGFEEVSGLVDFVLIRIKYLGLRIVCVGHHDFERHVYQ